MRTGLKIFILYMKKKAGKTGGKKVDALTLIIYQSQHLKHYSESNFVANAHLKYLEVLERLLPVIFQLSIILCLHSANEFTQSCAQVSHNQICRICESTGT